MANLNESREMELPFIQEVDAKVKELHQIIASLNNQQASLRVSLRKLKEKIGEKDEKVRLSTCNAVWHCFELADRDSSYKFKLIVALLSLTQCRLQRCFDYILLLCNFASRKSAVSNYQLLSNHSQEYRLICSFIYSSLK